MKIPWWVWIALTSVAACSPGSQVQQDRTATNLPGAMSVQPVPPLASLKDAAPNANWDERSVLYDDFDCDGVRDLAALGRRDGGVAVGVARASGGPPAILEFALSGSVQAAICAEPARLQTESQEQPDDSLEGFRASRTCKGLVLSGGECDPVHIYWNHERKGVGWWRN